MKAKKLIVFLFVGAMALLMGCSGDKALRLQQLEQLEQQNRSGEPMLNDSLAEDLVSYFDHHGDANERMRSRYILGRTYYCLGELPRALEMYNEAADCADTTSSDCDFAKLSRIYAQKASVFDAQIQPQSQLINLRLAEYYAWKGHDTLMALECYSLQVEPYSYLNNTDSVILICEESNKMFEGIDRRDRASQMRGREITSLIQKKELGKAGQCVKDYETHSKMFYDGDIIKGHEIYYYIKGQYYLAIQQLDSAEFIFRKELKYGKDFNNQIAAYKGLQKVYEQRRVPDSIAKYAKLSYELNDSAYLQSEMQNIQKFQASYNYNHQKRLAEEKANAARNAYEIIIALILFASVIARLWFLRHRAELQLKDTQYLQTQSQLEQAQSDLMELQEKNQNAIYSVCKKIEEIRDLQAQVAQYKRSLSIKEHANLEDCLSNAAITKELTGLLESNPMQSATQGQLRELRKLMNEYIPAFYETLNHSHTLRPIEYEVCMLIRCHFKPSAISKLLDRDDAYISNLRKGVLLKVYGIKGSPKELDERILQIV